MARLDAGTIWDDFTNKWKQDGPIDDAPGAVAAACEALRTERAARREAERHCATLGGTHFTNCGGGGARAVWQTGLGQGRSGLNPKVAVCSAAWRTDPKSGGL
eukprot:gene16733-biopygen17279